MQSEEVEDKEETLTAGERCKRLFSYHWHGWVLFIAPIIWSPFLFMEPLLAYRCAFVVSLMATYWVTEVMPLGVTALIPIVLFPLMGIMDSKTVCFCYFKDASMLFFGGLIVALGVEYSKLHKRVALVVILLVGCSPRRLHFALVIVTMFVSMWINNSATTAMMCPVIKAVLEELAASNMAKVHDDTKILTNDEPPYPSKIALCYYLGVAYSSSYGGLGTLIGTGTNVVFKGIFDGRFPGREETSFVKWSMYSVPIVVICVLCAYVVFQWQFMGLFRSNSPEAIEVAKGSEGRELAEQVIREKKSELGPLTMHEIQIAILFIIMIMLFIFRKPGFTEGWADKLNDKEIKTSFPVILLVILFFVLPVNYQFLKYCCCRRPNPEGTCGSLITWKFIHDNVPWSLVLLIGGGFTLSAGMKVSGLAVLLGNALKSLESLPPPALQFMCIFVAIVMTAFTSNMAMCNIILPVLLEMALAIEVHPVYISLPTAMALSYAFVFPVSTPANAIVAGYANIRTKNMFFAGLGPSIIGLFVTFIVSQIWAPIVFDRINEFPDWAKNHTA